MPCSSPPRGGRVTWAGPGTTLDPPRPRRGAAWRRGAEGTPRGSLTLTVDRLRPCWNLPNLYTVLALTPSPVSLRALTGSSLRTHKKHWRKARYVKHSQTLQPTQHQLLLCDWVLIKVLPRKTSLDPRSRRLYQVFLTPFVAVKYQGLKTWVRVLQRQVPAPTKDLLDPPAPLFHQADIITYQQSRVSQVPLHDTTS